MQRVWVPLQRINIRAGALPNVHRVDGRLRRTENSRARATTR
ncbi:hypothetical protein GGR26_000195 [Lewinella marina]|nr:hypothetical protein [Neolewinella marina]